MEVSSVAKDTGISPTKVRPLVDMVRGKKVDEALTILRLGLRTKTWSRFVLGTSEGSQEGFRASRKELEELVGRKGTTITMLRPAGTALIDGQKIDVVAEGTYVPKGSAIEVVQVEGHRVVVRAS